MLAGCRSSIPLDRGIDELAREDIQPRVRFVVPGRAGRRAPLSRGHSHGLVADDCGHYSTRCPCSGGRLGGHDSRRPEYGNTSGLAMLPLANAYHWHMQDQGRRAPDWEWDEIVLACDLVAQNGWQQLPAEDPRVIELSRLLRQMSIHPEEVRGDKFRN